MNESHFSYLGSSCGQSKFFLTFGQLSRSKITTLESHFTIVERINDC